MRSPSLVIACIASVGCSRSPEPDSRPAVKPAPTIAIDAGTIPAVVDAKRFADLATALGATIPADARVIGFGELHSRTDRADVRSSLARFTTDALPGLAAKLSDLVVETWVVDQTCGKQAAEATAKVEISMRRPPATHNEIAELAAKARAAKIQPLAMTITCADYKQVAPAGGEVDLEAMLTLTTRELARQIDEAVTKRDAEPGHRPWIAVYGGALHNDRFPGPGVEDWSYAVKADAVAKGHFVEIDLIVPELAELDPASQKQPWFPLVIKAATDVAVWQRGERSFVIVLARGVKPT